MRIPIDNVHFSAGQSASSIVNPGRMSENAMPPCVKMALYRRTYAGHPHGVDRH